MTITHPVAELRTARDLCQADAALDGAMLRQDGLLATLIAARAEDCSAPSLDHAALMRLVKSQQSLLSASRLGGSTRGTLNDAGELYSLRRKAA